tara:strand:+ start:3936 stop:4310 length:375 start_codon:yes stop_codon:yes gene_type:complete
LGTKLWVCLAALLGGSGVVLGALGAHALNHLEPTLLANWDTAVRFQFFHALALVGVGVLSRSGFSSRWLTASGFLFLAGVLLFCSALYALALGAPRGVAALAPVGGAGLVLAWLAMGVAALRSQ